MARTPGVEISNNDAATTDPSASDDGPSGWDVGSRWVNTTTGKVLFCVAVAGGAAVWKDVSTPGAGSHPVHTDTTAPTVDDDSSAGYAVGDHWIDTTAQKVYQALFVGVGAAIWERIDQPKPNNTATTDPSVTNDDSEGYEIGSLWVNEVEHTSFICTSATTGAARWKSSSLAGAGSLVNPGEFMFGTLLDYPSPGNASSGTVFYLRLKISAGVVITGMRTFIDSGGTPSRNIRMGIYTQAVPASPSGTPNTRVAQTAAVDTGGQNGMFMTVALAGGNYVLPYTGYYWIAIVSDSTSVKFAVTATARADFLPVRQESGTGATLPATAGALTNPVSSVIYVSAVGD